MDSQTGELLDRRYRIGPRLGRGGMATVYAATDLRLHRAVAVKLFHRPAGAVVVARLRREAELLGGLSHPGLLKVFDVSADAEQPYLVMQLADGCTLRHVIDRGPLGPTRTAQLGLRLAETLQHVHSRQIMHRDIKPSNVLLSKSGGCYLADFGIALAAGGARLTATGHCVGTAAYLAPEQVAGSETGPAADIYALGLVLLECLTGHPEYTGTEVEAAIARLSRPPHIPDSVPPALRTALLAMTARNPSERVDAAGSARLLAAAAADVPDRSASASTAVLAPVAPARTNVLDLEPARRRSRLTRGRLGGAVAASGVAAAATVLTILAVSGPDPVTPAAEQPPARGGTSPSMELAPPPQTAGSTVVVPPQQVAPPAGVDNGGQAKPAKSGKGQNKGGKPGKG